MNLSRLKMWIDIAEKENEKANERIRLTREYILRHLPSVPVKTVKEYMSGLRKQIDTLDDRNIAQSKPIF